MALMDVERPFGFPQPAPVDGETITLLIERESSGLGNKKLLETAVVPGAHPMPPVLHFALLKQSGLPCCFEVPLRTRIARTNAPLVEKQNKCSLG